MLREVAGRAHHRDLERPPHRHRDHVLVDLVGPADARVEPLRDDVGAADVDVHLDGDLGVLLEEARERRHDHARRGVLERRDAHRARRLVAQRAERGQLGVDVAEHRTQGGEQALAGDGGGDAPRGPREELEAEARLEPLHRVAERGRRHPELRGGVREALLVGDGHEGLEVVELVARH